MDAKKIVLMWIVVFIVSFIVDSIAHIGLAGDFVSKELAGVVKPFDSVSFLPIILEYMLVAAGITFFLTQTDAFKKPVSYSAFVGGFLGLLIYGIYSLINSAFLMNWPFSVVVINTVIGTVVLGLSAVAARLIFKTSSTTQK